MGNTGFGLGNTDSVAFSEELMADFAGHLDRIVSIGQALNLAKEDYFLSRDAFSSYDEKTLSEAELYGLPMYGVGAPPAPLNAPRPVAGAVARPGERHCELDEPLRRACSPHSQEGRCRPPASTVTPSFSGPVTGQHGSYYTNAGQVQAPNYRPLQPYVTLPASRTNLTAHGVVIDSLASEDHTGFNPDNVRPTVDLTANEPEPQFTDQAWPTKVPTLVSLDDPNGLQQRLNLTTGQFFTSTDGGTQTERLWTQIGGRVTYSPERGLRATDRRPDRRVPHRQHRDVQRAVQRSHRNRCRRHRHVRPGRVRRQQHRHLEERATRAGRDRHLVGRCAVHRERACSSSPRPATPPATAATAPTRGATSTPRRCRTTTGSITLTPSGTLGTGGWYTSSVNVTGTSSSPGVTITVSVDGGPFAPIPDTGITLTGDGAHTLKALGSDGSKATTVVLIDKTPPTIAFAPGTVAFGAHVPAFTCLDSGSGAAVCAGTQNGMPVNGGDPLEDVDGRNRATAAHATDVVGNQRQRQPRTVQVVKATPTVTWPTPAPITYGTKLSATQLNATASANSAPPAGHVRLQPGRRHRSAAGQPDALGHVHADRFEADYTTVSKSVTISVGFTQACITTTRTGPFTVSSGQSICVSSGGKLVGPVTVQAGGSLWINGGAVTGPFTATSAAGLTLCGSTITGPVTVTTAVGYVLFGGTGCAGNTITGPVSITKGTGGLSFVGNKVIGPLTITNNKGGFAYSGNTVTGPVTVSGNS